MKTICFDYDFPVVANRMLSFECMQQKQKAETRGGSFKEIELSRLS